jgi:hypothetical protein
LSTMTLAYWHLRAEKISEYPKWNGIAH